MGPSSGKQEERFRLAKWWLSPPRSGMLRLIAPWEYRHLRAFALARIVGAAVAVVPGLICLSYDAPWWAALFLTIAAISFVAGCWELTITRHRA